MIVIEVDSAVPACETIVGDTMYELVENADYKYLTALPLGSDNIVFPLCSKDRKHWSICYGAKKDGKPIDVSAFATYVESILNMGGRND